MSKIVVHHGDCLKVLPTLEAESIDSVVTDPPYHLTSITKRLGKTGSKPIQFGTDGAYARATKGFLGKEWDGGDIAFRKETWAEVLRVMKPGAHMCAFGGTRTFHRMVTAIEHAGFDIRDTIVWLYGQGFPKSKNQGAGRGTALKPANELIVLARKPLNGTIAENLTQHGVGALNIDKCRIGDRKVRSTLISKVDKGYSGGWSGRPKTYNGLDIGKWPTNVIRDDSKSIEHKLEEFSPGSSAFFYCAKASQIPIDSRGSDHPTIKPPTLISYLSRLITPPGGTVLDPFAGSGTTGISCLSESLNAVLIEREEEYIADINESIAYYTGKGAHKLNFLNRNKGKDSPLPLFDGAK